MKRLTPLDMNKNEVQNMRLQSLAAAPGSPVEALIYYNSADKKPIYIMERFLYH